MNLKDMLKKAWEKAHDVMEKIRDMHGPYDPAPEVRKKLEAKGYRFYDSTVSFPIAVPAKVTYVLTKNGLPIGGSWPIDMITEQYYRDYNEAVQEYEKEQKAAKVAAKKDELKP